ncbi:MAG: 4'-phosphopantetheinyl transferase superfamily protein [Stellaceae bacterium]
MAGVVIEIVWIDMDREDASLGHFFDTLDDEERARARRYCFARDRLRFIVRRGRLRELLARRLECAPSRIRFCRNFFGKPSIDASNVRFSLSHSHSIALYAITEGLEVGCDIERLDPHLPTDQIAERFFAPLEVRMLQSLAPALQVQGFFNCWTRKEAYVKARGDGLSLPLDGFVVSLAPGEPAALLHGCDGWSVESFETVPDYHAAVVAENAGWRLDLAAVGRASLGKYDA